MAETRGVFSLNNVYDLKVLDEWIPLDEVWISPSPFLGESLNNAYFGGTNDDSFEMNFTNDSVSNTPSIPNSVYGVNRWSVGNQFFGYLAGSQTPASATKITYSTSSSELIPTITSLPISSLSEFSAAVGNGTNGYVGTNLNQSLIHKITYSTDNVEALPSDRMISNAC